MSTVPTSFHPEKILATPEIRSCRLKDDGAIPNNPRLPLLIYKRALSLPGQDPAAAIERLLAKNQWGGSWRNGIYSYHHYHSTAHEVLVAFCGSATVQLGGNMASPKLLNLVTSCSFPPASDTRTWAPVMTLPSLAPIPPGKIGTCVVESQASVREQTRTLIESRYPKRTRFMEQQGR